MSLNEPRQWLPPVLLGFEGSRLPIWPLSEPIGTCVAFFGATWVVNDVLMALWRLNPANFRRFCGKMDSSPSKKTFFWQNVDGAACFQAISQQNGKIRAKKGKLKQKSALAKE